MIQRRAVEGTGGLVVIVGLALLVFFVFVIGDFSAAFQPHYRLQVLFETANGINDGAPVQYAGVEVGKVERLSIIYPKDQTVPRVQLGIVLPESVNVRADDEASF